LNGTDEEAAEQLTILLRIPFVVKKCATWLHMLGVSKETLPE
jgi:hypothetical protein